MNIDYDDFDENEKFEVNLFGYEFSDDEANIILGKGNKLFEDEGSIKDGTSFLLGESNNFVLGESNKYHKNPGYDTFKKYYGPYGYYLAKNYIRTLYDEYGSRGDYYKQRVLQRSRFIDKVISFKREENSSLKMHDEDLDAHLLRTAIYWETSGKLNLAFLPDFTRIPIISGYNARLRKSLRTFIDAKVNDIVTEELEAAMRIAGPVFIPIPNAVSKFLSRYSKTSNIEDAFDNMRSEFSEDRNAIVRWEGKMRKSDKLGYKESLEVMEEVASSLAALRKLDKTEIAISAAAV